MEPLKTEAVGRIAYGPHEPTSFMLSDDLLKTYPGDRYRRLLDALNLMLQRGLTAVNDTRGAL